MTLMRTIQVNPAEEPFAMLSGKRKRKIKGRCGLFMGGGVILTVVGHFKKGNGTMCHKDSEFPLTHSVPSNSGFRCLRGVPHGSLYD